MISLPEPQNYNDNNLNKRSPMMSPIINKADSESFKIFEKRRAESAMVINIPNAMPQKQNMQKINADPLEQSQKSRKNSLNQTGPSQNKA